MRCLTLLILIMTGLMDLFRRRPVWAGASAPPGTGPASARAPKLRCAPSRLASRPGGQGARRSRASGLPPGTPGSRPDGGSLPNAAHRRTRQRRQSAPVHANAFETPPCAPGAGPLPPQRPARRPSADRTMHSNEKRLLSNSKSRRTSDIRVIISAYQTEKMSDDHPYIWRYTAGGLGDLDHPYNDAPMPCQGIRVAFFWSHFWVSEGWGAGYFAGLRTR